VRSCTLKMVVLICNAHFTGGWSLGFETMGFNRIWYNYRGSKFDPCPTGPTHSYLYILWPCESQPAEVDKVTPTPHETTETTDATVSFRLTKGPKFKIISLISC
jgi:hypothetical protein